MTKQSGHGSRRLRRQFVINPRFQWKYTGLAALTVFVLTVAAGGTLYLIQFREAQARLLSSGWAHARENTMLIVGFAAAFAVVVAVGFAVWSVFVTHRICGPLYVVQGCLDTLIEGRFPKQRPLRTKDEFGDFYEHFWRAVDVMRARQEAENESLSEVLRTIRVAAESGDDGRRQHFKAIEERLKALLDANKEALGRGSDNVRTPSEISCEADSPRTLQHAGSLS